jgi:lactate dehydrogenase-like 2-hydroxyacid dehydrogenase
MKPGAYLINTARGGSSTTTRSPTRSTAAASPAPGSTSIRTSRKCPQALLGLENVVLLPHLGSANAETRIAMGMKALANVEAFASGATLPDRVA